MHALMLVALPLFLVVVFLGGIGTSVGGLLGGIGKYVLVVVLVILIKNTNPARAHRSGDALLLVLL